MGVDIHMNYISSNGEYIARNVFDGRNYEWFDYLQMVNCCKKEYDSLPVDYGIPEEVPEEIKQDYEHGNEYGYYGFHYMKVSDFCKWYEEKRPDLDAGWVTTREKWLYETKGIVPDDPRYFLSNDETINSIDYHFIVFEDIYDCSRWLYNNLKNNYIDENAYIVYYFDR